MPRYVIERNFAAQLEASKEANDMIRLINDEEGVKWLFSFLSADRMKTYCLYEAPNEEAIRIAGERQLRDEVPTLLKLLGDDDESVRDAALGALIAMRDRRAVRELTQSRSLRDRREMRKIIEAISILGGQEADEYLSFVAATHDDDEIRTEAAAARARLQRREAEAGSAAR